MCLYECIYLYFSRSTWYLRWILFHLFCVCLGVCAQTTWRSQFSTSAMWVLGVKFRLSGLAEMTFTCWASKFEAKELWEIRGYSVMQRGSHREPRVELSSVREDICLEHFFADFPLTPLYNASWLSLQWSKGERSLWKFMSFSIPVSEQFVFWQ